MKTFSIIFVLMLVGCPKEPQWEGLPCPCASGYQCVDGICVGMNQSDIQETQTQICEPYPPPPIKGEPKVAFLYVGPVLDNGWTKTHDDGRKYLEAHLPNVKTEYAPSVSAVDAPAKIEEFIAKGNNIIIGTSYDFLVPIQNKAANHPDINFLICSGFVTSPNMGSYFGRMYQAKWLAGMAAGYATKKNRIGIVAPVPIPEVIRHINALTLGALKVNPKVKVHVEWIYNWFDVQTEGPTTEKLINAGADVIVSMTDTTIPLETVVKINRQPEYKDNPILVVGYDNENACDFAVDDDNKSPNKGVNFCLTTPYWNWGPILVSMVKQMIDNTWCPKEPIWEQMKSDKNESIVYISDLNTKWLTGEQRIEIVNWIGQLTKPGKEGQQLPFKSPIYDNKGKLRLPEGQYFSDDDLLKMCWYVNGVIGEDDKPATVPPSCPGQK